MPSDLYADTERMIDPGGICMSTQTRGRRLRDGEMVHASTAGRALGIRITRGVTESDPRESHTAENPASRCLADSALRLAPVATASADR
jgi:hypothetical protein